jgi:hypothetical protein
LLLIGKRREATKSGTNESKNRYTTIPNHPGDMPEGTVRAILREAGISSIRRCFLSDLRFPAVPDGKQAIDIFSPIAVFVFEGELRSRKNGFQEIMATASLHNGIIHE